MLQVAEPISDKPFDFTQIRKATNEDYQKIKVQLRDGNIVEKRIAYCDISVDLEGCGGEGQALNGTISIGFAAFARHQGHPLFAHEWAVDALAGLDDSKQIEWWLADEQRKASFDRILAAQRPRMEVANELRALVAYLTAVGWTVHLLMRPVGYDFRELTAFFQTLGIEILSERLVKDEKLTGYQVIQQACCAYDLRQPRPSYYDERNNMESPFGFGGASQVTDIGQQIAAWVRLFVPPDQVQPDFNKFLSKIVGRQLIHSGKQDAIDQYFVWRSVCQVVDRVNSAINSGTIADFLKERETFCTLYQ